MKHTLVGILRIAFGWIFLWAFIDKTWGLGYATTPEKAWLEGMSPTEGFLTHATQGPFAELFQSLAGNVVVDWLFMLGLLGIGVALILGIGLRIAGWSGALLMLLMWLAVLPPANNPIVDDHIIYMLLLILVALKPAVGEHLGLGSWWKNTSLVKKFGWLA